MEIHKPRSLKAQVVCEIGALYEARGQHDNMTFSKVSPY